MRCHGTFILGTEFMMPLPFQKWLREPLSRIVSNSGLATLGIFFTGTRPGPLRPGTWQRRRAKRDGR